MNKLLLIDVNTIYISLLYLVIGIYFNWKSFQFGKKKFDIRVINNYQIWFSSIFFGLVFWMLTMFTFKYSFLYLIISLISPYMMLNRFHKNFSNNKNNESL